MKNLNKKFLLILIICLVGIVSVTVLSVRMGTKSILFLILMKVM